MLIVMMCNCTALTIILSTFLDLVASKWRLQNQMRGVMIAPRHLRLQKHIASLLFQVNSGPTCAMCVMHLHGTQSETHMLQMRWKK